VIDSEEKKNPDADPAADGMNADEPHADGARSDEADGDDRSWLDRAREASLPGYLEKWRTRFRTDPQTGLPLRPLRPNLDEGALSIGRAFSTGRGLRLALKLFAPSCLGVFLISFWAPIEWLEKVLRACSTAGLIGFGTNWVAIKMLFRPRETRPIFGQGLIPSQRDELIQKVADEVIEKLINEEIIRRELDESRLISRLTEETAVELRRVVRDPEFIQDTKRVALTYAARFVQSESFREDVATEVEKRVERVAGSQFAHALVGRLRNLWREPILRLVNKELDDLPETLERFIGELDSALDHIPAYLENHQPKIDAALTRITMSLIREIDVRQLVTKQLSTVTSDQLEEGFLEFADDKLSYITLLGGLLGLVGGLVIIWPLYSVAAIVVIFTGLALLDVALKHLLVRFRATPSNP
jgi:uncharacterized membrane protein YheB (UPF0754 family)